MALVNTKDITTEGDLGGHKIAMSIDTNSLVHLMSVLADLYSDPAAAVIREYITNALDSHIAAGQTRPVEVTTPSSLSPYFHVEDFGVGLSVEDIENIYSKFGASTKRTNNDEAGMLGLGAKSALTFCEQFTIIATKDGLTAAVSVSRSSDGTGQMEIVNVAETGKPNGVKISIPVNKNIGDFNVKINEFARFVRRGLIVDGKRYIDEAIIGLSDKIRIRPREWGYYDVQDRVVMGNVSYPVDRSVITDPELKDNLSSKHVVYYFADMGDVDFTPSREELMYTPRTLNTLRKMREQYTVDLSESLQSQIDSEVSYREAFNRQTRLRRDYGVNVTFAYNGAQLPPESIDVMAASCSGIKPGASPSNPGPDRRFMNNVPSSGVIVHNWINKRFTKVQATKLEKHLQSKGIDVSYALLVESIDYPQLFEDWTIIDWEDVKGEKIDRPTSNGRPIKRWESYRHGLIPVDTTKEIYYASRSEVQTSYISPHDAVSDTSEFFYVTDKEQERFVNDYPKAKHIRDLYKTKVREYLDNLTQEDINFFRLSYSFSNSRLLDHTKILDPELAQLVKNSNGRGDTAEDARKWAEFDQIRHFTNRLPHNVRNSPEWQMPDVSGYGEKLLKKYPLVENTRIYSYDETYQQEIRDHLTMYVNMIYLTNTGSELNG